MKSKMFWTLTIALMISISLITLTPIYGKKPPETLLTEEELAMAAAVGDGSYAMDVDLTLSYDPDLNCIVDDLGRGCWRPAGSDADDAAALWIKEEMERIGLQNVAMKPFPCHGFTYNSQPYVQVKSPITTGEMLGAVPSGIPGTVQQNYSDPDGGITREVVYVGLGRKQDYIGKDVEGKIVLVDIYSEEMYWSNFPHMQAELEGAVGLVVHWIEYQQGEGFVCTHDSEARPTIPMITVSHRDFAVLKDLALAGPTVVKMYADCEVTIPDWSHNVVGYIPGTTNPDELIIHGAIFDKHWYGFHHHISDVSAMLQSAKALIDSGYEPSCTLVYVAIGAEEYGWTDTLNAWAIGSHFLAHYDHPDWGGRTRAFVEVLGSLKEDYTVYLGGQPGTYLWRQSVIQVINEFFTTHEPWSDYYVPASTWFGALPSTWIDNWNFGTSGMETMSCCSTGSTLYQGMYHCQNDTGIVSAEALAMNAIANGINTIRMDRALLVPYNYGKWADLIEATVDKDAITTAGISTGRIYAELNELERIGNRVWNLIKDTTECADADAVNALMMQAAKEIFSLIIVGGWGDQSMLGHEHYQVDTTCLREAIEGLQEGDPYAFWWLADVYGGWYAYNVDYEVYYHFMIECTSPDWQGITWGDQGREAHFTDVYVEFNSLLEKLMTGDTDYSAEIASLQPKYETAVENLEDKVNKLVTTLSTVNDLLKAVEALLK